MIICFFLGIIFQIGWLLVASVCSFLAFGVPMKLFVLYSKLFGKRVTAPNGKRLSFLKFGKGVLLCDPHDPKIYFKPSHSVTLVMGGSNQRWLMDVSFGQKVTVNAAIAYWRWAESIKGQFCKYDAKGVLILPHLEEQPFTIRLTRYRPTAV
jgi:hypothetical protein